MFCQFKQFSSLNGPWRRKLDVVIMQCRAMLAMKLMTMQSVLHKLYSAYNNIFPKTATTTTTNNDLENYVDQWDIEASPFPGLLQPIAIIHRSPPTWAMFLPLPSKPLWMGSRSGTGPLLQTTFSSQWLITGVIARYRYYSFDGSHDD